MPNRSADVTEEHVAAEAVTEVTCTHHVQTISAQLKSANTGKPTSYASFPKTGVGRLFTMARYLVY
jgi:hypothetical protein